MTARHPIVEIRRYTTLPGMRESWADYMRTVVVPFQEARGMRVLGQYVGDEDDTTFVWIREFDDPGERDRLMADVYGSTEWCEDIAPVVRRHLRPGGSEIVVLRPAGSGSPPEDP